MGYQRLLGAFCLLLFLLLPAPLWAQPDDTELKAEERRLLDETLLEPGDLPGLMRLNAAARAEGGQPFPLSPELTLPDPGLGKVQQGFTRIRVGLLLENHQALAQETRRREFLNALALACQSAEPAASQPEVFTPWLAAQMTEMTALEVFARRQLRTLDAADLEALKGNPMLDGSPDNVAELHLLTARAYLDQGQMSRFETELAGLQAYIERPGALPTLVIGYHCLSWQRSGSSQALLEATHKVIEVGKSYHFGDRPIDDIFWISSGDELVEMTRALLSRYQLADEHQADFGDALSELAVLSFSWATDLATQEIDFFAFTWESLWEDFERRQGAIALLMTTEKLSLFFYEHTTVDDAQKARQLAEYLELLRYRRAQLAGGFWLLESDRFFPARGDLWRGSALERLEARTEVQLWKLDPGANQPVAPLISKVLSLSPQDEALELALDWSDSLGLADPKSSLELLAGAEKIAEQFEFPIYWLLLSEKRRLLLDGQGLTIEAAAEARVGLRVSQQLVSLATPLRDGRSVGELARDCSDYLASQQLAKGETEQALAELEQGRALQSAHQLAAGASRSTGEAGVVMREIGQARADQTVLARREAMGEKVGDSALLAQTKSDFLKHSRELQASHPELYDRTLSVKPVEFPRLQKHLPQDVLLLQYFPTENALYVFAMTHDQLILKSVPLGKADLDKMLVSYLRLLRRIDESQALESSARELYARLLSPVQEQLDGKSTLLLIPTGRLNYLPFASLVDDQGRTLGSQHQLSILGKSSDLLDVLVAKPQRGGSVAVLADPGGDLPAARQEGKALAALFPGGSAVYGDDATRAGLTAAMGGQSFLHLATHGEIDSSDPSQNYLLLADGQKLTAEDIFSLPMDEVRMVTLSACNTALGQSEPTASVVSLAENFWVTGPASVVATLWAVNDLSTSLFMQKFYLSIVAGQSKAQALQSAQTALRESKEFSHPYYWSPFVLLGDWR